MDPSHLIFFFREGFSKIRRSHGQSSTLHLEVCGLRHDACEAHHYFEQLQDTGHERSKAKQSKSAKRVPSERAKVLQSYADAI
jgi:hypothetical protein